MPPAKRIRRKAARRSQAAGRASGAKHVEEQRRILASIVENSEDAIISKDLNGIITSWNPAATRILGYSAGEMIGQSILEIIPPELYGDEPVILDNIRNGKRIDHFETVRVGKGGKRLDVSLTISPIRDDSGAIGAGDEQTAVVLEEARLRRHNHGAYERWDRPSRRDVRSLGDYTLGAQAGYSGRYKGRAENFRGSATKESS